MNTIALGDLFAIDRLELLFSGQTNWNTVLSANMSSINLILPFLKRVVEDTTLAIPPSSGLPSSVYYVPGNAEGIWVGHEHEFAVYDPTCGEWRFYTPFEGYTFYCKTDKRLYVVSPINNRMIANPLS